MQKALFDYTWGLPLVRTIDTLGAAISPPMDFNDLAAKLNEGNRQHADEIHRFEQAYQNEIVGCLGLYMGRAADILEQIERDSEMQVRLTEQQRKYREEGLYYLFVEAFKKPEVAKQLPTLHIQALCHASVRWDKKRQLKGNDIHDFHHAAAAIAYCRIFLTEKPLQIMLTANHIALDKQFDCKIISEIQDAIECLKIYA